MVAAQDVSYPQHQLVDVERLADIIVRAEVEAAQAILFFIAGGQEKEGNIVVQPADPFRQLEAIHTR